MSLPDDFEMVSYADAAELITSQAAEIERLKKDFEDYLVRLSSALGGISRYSNEQGDYRTLEDWAAFLLKRTESLRLNDNQQRRQLAEARAALDDIEDAASSFRDESGDEVAGQVIIRVRAARTLTNGGENGR